MELLYILLASVFAISCSVIIFMNKRFSYFKKRGVPQLETEFFYGNGKDLILKKFCQGEYYINIYKKFKNLRVQHGGVYLSIKPIWVPVDPELIKGVLVKDFTYFSAHLEKFTDSLFFNNIFFMHGEEWKNMRRKLTPTFTSGKMKMMFNIMLEKTNGLSNLVNEMCETGQAYEIKQVLARFTTDIIGSCGFGIECNSMQDTNSQFFIESQKLFNIANVSVFYLILVALGIRKIPVNLDLKPIERFFTNVVQDTIKYREENKVVRNDFLHLMIQLKNKGAVTESNDNEDIFKKTVDEEVISIEEIAGQCLLFFNAGFETSSTTMSYALLELTQNQDVQQKLREEVRKVLEKHNGKLSYDVLHEMTYLDYVIKETLRKYPPVPVLPRLCTKTYRIPDTDSVIEKGTNVNIPVWGLQMDPEYFPNPEKFIPERFNADNEHEIRDMTYMPFGEGPRQCIGLRFGVMQSKAGLATLINKYNFTLDNRTPYPPPYEKGLRTIIAVQGGIWLRTTKVD